MLSLLRKVDLPRPGFVVPPRFRSFAGGGDPSSAFRRHLLRRSARPSRGRVRPDGDIRAWAGPPAGVAGQGGPTRPVVAGCASGRTPHRAGHGYHRRMGAFATRLRLPAQAQDALLAVFVTFFQIRGTILVAPGEEAFSPLADPFYLGYLLLAGSGLVLLVRRRWPIAVFATVAAVSVLYYAAGYPDGPGWVGLFVAAYTLTAQGDGDRSLKIAAAGIGALTVVWLLTADRSE